MNLSNITTYPSKKCNHFFLSLLCPPTSTIVHLYSPIYDLISLIAKKHQFTYNKTCFNDTSGSLTRIKNVRIGWNVVLLGKSIYIIHHVLQIYRKIDKISIIPKFLNTFQFAKVINAFQSQKQYTHPCLSTRF